jgi:predicted MFS family arabinose efflux permease
VTAAAPQGTASSRQRWTLLALLFVCRMALGYQFQALGSVSDALGAQMGLGQAEIGLLIGLFMLPGLVLALPAGYAGRHVADRTLVAGGLLALALGGALAAVAESFGMLAGARVAAGAGFVVSTLYFTKMVADWFSGKELATAMSVLVMSWPFGIAAAQVSQVWLAAQFGWRVVFGVAAAYCALAALALFLAYRAPGAARPAATAPAAIEPPGLTRAEWRLTLLAALAWGLFNAGYIVFLSFAPRLLVAQGYGATPAASVVSLASWVMIFSATACGQIADRLGRRDLIINLCMLGAVAALLMLRHGGLAVAACLLFGLVGAAPAGVVMALTGEAMAPRRRAFGMGVFYRLYFVLVTIAPAAAGWLHDRGRDPAWPILLAAALFAATALSSIAFRAVKRRA